MYPEFKDIVIRCFSTSFRADFDKFLIDTNMLLFCCELEVHEVSRITFQIISRLNGMDHLFLPVA